MKKKVVSALLCAAVSSKGVIKAKKAGKVTITVKSNGITNKCKVTVKNK